MVPLLHFRSWRKQVPPHCTPNQQVWLTRSGALTTGLLALGQFKLQVIYQGVELAMPEETHLMGYHPLWCREVLMSINGMPCVLARSVTPLRASYGCWQGMRKLGRRPLAALLYHDPSIVRSVFEISRIGRSHGLYRSLSRTSLDPNIEHTLYARRSVFWRQRQPLLVSECFLPAFWSMTEPDF